MITDRAAFEAAMERLIRYPAQVAAGRMKQADATHHRNAMLAVLATLKDYAALIAAREKPP
jgi:hypothetical protein